jgi:alpha-mannosidase
LIVQKRASYRLTRRQVLKLSAGLLSSAALAKLCGEPRLVDRAAAQTAPERIYIAPDDHTDYLWTSGEHEYRQAFLEMLDYYLDLADDTENEAPEHQSRWNCDGSFWMWTYEKYRPAADFQRLIARIRSGHISVPLNALCLCLGGAPAEAVLRGMYYPGQIERRYSLRFPLAYSVENQTLPYGLGSLWAGAGAKYSWKGICGCATRVPSAGDREHEIYWWVGPDGSRVLMKWYSLVSNQSLGGYAEAYEPSSAVELLGDKCFGSPEYDYGLAGAFGHGWDGLKVLTDQFVSVAKAKMNSQRQVIVSNEEDFFQDFEATYGSSLPSTSASFGNEWDLYCASMAEVSARVKRAVEKLRAAEALASLVSLKNPTFMDGRQEARDLAWMDLGLYWEHDWTADGPVSRETRRDWQRRLATEIEAYVDTLYDDAATALAAMIQRSGPQPRFYVFNPLSWIRTDITDLPYSGGWPAHVVDLTTGEEVPSQLVNVDSQQYLRVLAPNVPSVGYKVFEVQPGTGSDFTDGAPIADASQGTMQNSLYEIAVAPRGAITSLKDKSQNNREFARNIDGYYLNDLGSSSGTLTVENAGPVSVTVRITAPKPITHVTRITLIRNARRIDIRNEITQNFGDIHTWRFGFELSNPDVWHEEVGAVVRAKLLADGGHYSPRNARYDWLTLNHFADIGSAGRSGATLSNADCYFMKLGNSSSVNLDTGTPQISPLAGGQVDGPSLGIPNQGGDTHFLQRFALQTHEAYSPVEAMKFALEHQNPLVAGAIVGGSVYPETSYSLVTISDPNVLLWALKPAEDGIQRGVIARVWNLSAAAVDSFSLALGGESILSAQRTSHIETVIEPASVIGGMLAADLNAHEIKTFLARVLPFAGRGYLPLVRRR